MFDKMQQDMVAAQLYRVNIVYDYNNFMGYIDISDQLRESYHFDH